MYLCSHSPANPSVLKRISVFFDRYDLHYHFSYVPNLHRVSHSSPVRTGIVRSSYGTHGFDHLTADGTGFAGSELTVVTLIQGYAYFTCCLHLELIHCGLCFGYYNLVGTSLRHGLILPFYYDFFGSMNLFVRESLRFLLFRKHSCFRDYYDSFPAVL